MNFVFTKFPIDMKIEAIQASTFQSEFEFANCKFDLNFTKNLSIDSGIIKFKKFNFQIHIQNDEQGFLEFFEVFNNNDKLDKSRFTKKKGIYIFFVDP